MTTGWNQDTSPFHQGERTLQERAGIRDKMEGFGRRVIRDHLPEQHREFYANLRYLYVGSVDDGGRPWASMVTGEPGFISTPTDKRMTINATPHPGDPLSGNISAGQPVGLLGLDLASRRRNRVNGRVDENSGGTFAIAVDQAFGNCPKYIRAREVTGPRDTANKPLDVTHGVALTDQLTQLVSQAETFFIASINPQDHAGASADVSHRGGKPGFVRVADKTVLSFPDFRGNGHFNTFGNLALCDRAGLLFVNFDNGDVLQLTGRAQLIWDTEELAAFQGAERLVRFELESYVFSAGALGLRFADGEASPFVEPTGDW